MKAIGCLYLGLLLHGGARADLPADPGAYSKWEAKLLASVKSQEDVGPEEAIPKLGRWVFQLSLPTNREKGDRPVFAAAQAALLAIPGHAEYYEKNIKAAQSRFEDAATNLEKSPLATQLNNELMYGFATLENLPSPETVRVLGDFLGDMRGVDENGKWIEGGHYDGFRGTGPPCIYAAGALMKLPLKSKPTHDKRTATFGDVRPWQLWYEQVKAGNRTFSFEGDPKVYSLAGPVTAERSPAGQRPERRPEAAVHEPGAGAGGVDWRVIAGAVGLVVIVAGIFKLRRNRAG